MKIIFILLYFFIIVTTFALCKTAKRADEQMQRELEDLNKKNK